MQEQLCLILGVNSAARPAGVRLRFIPEASAACDKSAVNKLLQLHSRQKGFVDCFIKSKNVGGIVTLDYAALKENAEGFHPTLREKIMGINSSKTGKNLLHSAAPFYLNDEMTSFHFAEANETEAVLMMHNMVPCLRHHHGPFIDKCFHEFKVRLAEGVAVDANGNVVAALDQDVDDILGDDADYHATAPEPPQDAPLLPALARPDHSNLNFNTRQSVSTLGTLGTNENEATTFAADLNFAAQPSSQDVSHLSDDDTMATAASVRSLAASAHTMQANMTLLME